MLSPQNRIMLTESKTIGDASKIAVNSVKFTYTGCPAGVCVDMNASLA